MANNNDAKPTFRLRVLVDEKKNKVVLAEADKDFVDVLCSLLSLPMGTIVRLLEKHHHSSILGCFHNLYKSVSDLTVDNFETETCKNLLLYPRSLNESHCRKLKLNIDDTEALKFFVCSHFMYFKSCCKVYSNFKTSRCCCGRSMTCEFTVKEESKTESDEAFVRCRSSFIITDDLKVGLNSVDLVLNVLNDLGYSGLDNLQEMFVDVGFEEVLNLLVCLFISVAPLTDLFLRKRIPTRENELLTPLVQESKVAAGSDGYMTLKVYVSKIDGEILFAECTEFFINCLFMFLTIPLEFAWNLCNGNVDMGCVGNLCRTVPQIQTDATASNNRMLPWYYNFSAQFVDVVIQDGAEYEYLTTNELGTRLSPYRKFVGKVNNGNLFGGEKILKFVPMDPTSLSGSPISDRKVCFVKRETSFIVTDDLLITPMSSLSTVSMLRKMKMKNSDIDQHDVHIRKAEVVNLLSASFATTSALTIGLSNLLP